MTIGKHLFRRWTIGKRKIFNMV